jgi:hypothetical protein
MLKNKDFLTLKPSPDVLSERVRNVSSVVCVSTDETFRTGSETPVRQQVKSKNLFNKTQGKKKVRRLPYFFSLNFFLFTLF